MVIRIHVKLESLFQHNPWFSNTEWLWTLIALESVIFVNFVRFLEIRGVLWKALKSMWMIYFSRDGLCNFFRDAPFHFRLLFCFKIDHVHFYRNAPLFYVRFFRNDPFFLSDSENGKNCICSHVQNTSFKGFLGHFMIPP